MLEQKNNEQNGITLISLVITIIILIIITGIAINMLSGENGILTKASEAKIYTALGSVKEELKLKQGEKLIENIDVTPETLLVDGIVKRTVQMAEDGNYYMYYAIKEKSLNGMQGLGKGKFVFVQSWN